MATDVTSILELCGIGGLAFWLIGFCLLLAASHTARDEYRSKGYLRAPSGLRWFRFLLLKQYDAFSNPSTRLLFGLVHLCLLAVFVSITAIVVLVSSELLLGGVNGFQGGGTTPTNPEIPPQ